jgi:hypothetical protein
MNKEFVIDLTQDSLRFVQLPDSYDEDIRNKGYIMRVGNRNIVSASFAFIDQYFMFLPGSDKTRDQDVIKYVDVSYEDVLSNLTALCKKYGYNLTNINERTVTL